MEARLLGNKNKNEKTITRLKLRKKSETENTLSELLGLFYTKSKESSIYVYYEFDGDIINNEDGVAKSIINDIFENKRDMFFDDLSLIDKVKQILGLVNEKES